MQYLETAQIEQQITQIILTSSEPQTLLARISEALGQLFQVDACWIVAAVNSATPQISVWRAERDLVPAERSAALLDYLARFDDVTSTEPLASQLQGVDGDGTMGWGQEVLPARSVLKICTRFQSLVNGIIVLGRGQPHTWRRWEKDQLIKISDWVAIAIAQVQLTQQVQALTVDRAVQRQHSLDIQATLYEKTHQQINQQRQLEQLKDEFISSMSHELRTPLTTMSLAIRMLRQPELPPERRDQYLEILEQECNKEIDLINDLLSLQQLEANPAQIQPQPTDLRVLLKELTQAFEQKWANKRLTLKVDCPARSPSENEGQSLMLSTDPDSLHRVLRELLTNAGKYSDPDTTVCLQVTHQAQPSGKQVILTLTNVGPGILPTDLKDVFEKFHRGQGVTQQAIRGTGLGLALVKCLVAQLSGTIEVSSCPMAGSQTARVAFTLTLPQPSEPLSV